ncbi:undecaprenyldiphospho-muramoylpentapeptide beta-N-acetylglucosaminyltransferase [Marinagarivorans algicola]|uniref:undecaprenyldiphospho-muramoylpentapeptide beta-N-acetylglucosaminyltransferase n=2 Tax=Marinagarivorans algicola TaxID=1513270 RepID=UPI001EE3E4A0|nr:undecaprenyldiphospho-muramoylpentapeptide beta-N-acetylglucosaminyltransferase [Marinagarivorans algicola]
MMSNKSTCTQAQATSKILIMAGGTGGHVFPALAVAKHLQQRGVEVHWIGTTRGIEAKIVPAHTIPLHTIDIAGLRGKSWLGFITGPFAIAKAIMQARHIIQLIKPNVVLGMGGYAAGPGGIAARLLGVPLIVHEQNATPGSTNKILAKLAQHVLCGFPGALNKGVFVGNPVREVFYQQPLPELRFATQKSTFNVLILGGSLGARALNQTVPAALALLPETMPMHVVHQSGTATRQQALEAYQTLQLHRPLFNVELPEFIDNVAEQIAAADLVICRAGALTIAELAAVGAASILVPFPHAIDDHQTANARWLSDKGAAILCPESDLTAQYLAQQLQQLLPNHAKLKEMANLALMQSDRIDSKSNLGQYYKKQTATQRVSRYCAEYLNV